MAGKSTNSALKFAATYSLAAGVYIVVSDVIAYQLAEVQAESYLNYGIVKGLGFVLVTSTLLYFLLRRHFQRFEHEVSRQDDTERALRSSRDQLAAAQQIARLGSWEADLETRHLTWSSAVYDIFGVTPDQFGHTVEAFFSYVHADDREALARAQQRSLEDLGRLEIEHRIVRPDGEVRYVLERAELRTNHGGKPVVQIGTVQDITERKHVELELANRNRQQAAIAELGMEALGNAELRSLMDRAMATASRILEMEYAGVLEYLPDRQLMRLVTGIGWPQEDLGTGTVPADHHSQAGYTLSRNEPVVVEDLRTETRFSGPQVLLERGVVSGISAVIRSNDAPWGVLGVHSTRRRRFSDADVTFVQALANIVGDVLQRENALAAIRERNVIRQMASEAAALGGWAYDPASNTMTWSEEVARIHEVAPDYVPNVTEGIDFYAPEYREQIAHRFQDCLEKALPYDEELQIITARNRRIWVRVIGRPEQDHAGRVVRVHGAIQDISERKSLESMLHQSQRLEAVGQLTGGIAHDFNNLLTVILGNSDQLARAAGDDAELRSLADTTHQAAKRGAELTNRLLAYARKQPLEPKPTDVAALLGGMDQLLRRSLGEQVEIETIRGGGLWTAMVDPAQLESAVLNLCLNARDAMPEGGRLTLETANVHLDNDYARQAMEITPGQYVMIAVTDSGHGVAPELTDRVFEPFFTTKPSGQGSGLGLSMVYGFAKQSRGHVKLYSEPDQGTTVKLYLPRTWQNPEVSERQARSSSPRGRGQCVLVVEDDDLVRRFVADQVTALGYEVVTAAGGTQAMAILEQRTDIDLLFTDVVMPGAMDGRQLAEAARARYPNLPVLFTSGYTENAIVHQGRLDPGIALLNKPYRLTDLAKKLESVLNPGPAS